MALYVERDGKRVQVPREVEAEGPEAVTAYVESKLPTPEPPEPDPSPDSEDNEEESE